MNFDCKNDIKNAKCDTKQKMVNDLNPILLSNNLEKCDVRSHVERRSTQFIAAIIVCLGGASAGSVVSWTSPVLPELESENSPLPITEDQGTWIASILTIGGLFGSITIGTITNKFSRKLTITFLTFPLLLSWALIVFVRNVNIMYFARFIAGFSAGGFCTVCPMYITEIATTKLRGTLGTCFQLFINLGALLTNIVGAFFNYIEISVMLAIIPLLLLIGVQFLPDSPIYLMMKGNRKRAEDAVRWLRGKNCNVQLIVSDMQKQIDEASGRKAAFRDILSTAGRRKALFGAVGLTFFQAGSGCGAVGAYTVQIFKLSGSSLDSHFQAICVALVSLIFSGLLFGLIGKIGRKIFLLLSGTTMAVCLGSLATYFLRKENEYDVSDLNWLPLASLMLFMVGFHLGYGPMPRIFITETFTSDLRGYASGVVIMFAWGFGFLVSKNFDLMIDTFRISGTFFIYMTICIGGVIFVFFYIPETKGKSLEDIQNKLNRTKQPVKNGDFSDA